MDSQGSRSIKDTTDPPRLDQCVIIKIAFRASLAWSELIKLCPTLASYSGRSFPTIYKSPDRSFSSAGVGHCHSHFKSCKFPCFERYPQQTDPFLESKTVPLSPVCSFSFLAQNRNLSLIKSQHLLHLSTIYHASKKNAWRTSSHHYQATLARMLRHDIFQTYISNAVSASLWLLVRYQFKSQQRASEERFTKRRLSAKKNSELLQWLRLLHIK